MSRLASAHHLAKRAIDLIGATSGLFATAPIMAATAVAIRMSMGRPIFFTQQRPGHRGRPFHLIKFRTMRQAAPGEGPETDAQRLTAVGKFIRASSLDELPTLLNVLRGDMSLVGPRPLLMEYLPRYTPEQARRHDAPPGITGWAQINGRNSLSWEEKFRLDVWYVDNWSLALDLRILAMTLAKVLRREGISAEGHPTMPMFRGTAEAGKRKDTRS